MKRYRQNFKRISVAFLFFLSASASAQMLSHEALLEVLQEGGHVIVMRHVSSPRQVPTTQTANPDNVNLERELDEVGREDARALGESLGRLNVVISEVESSPTFRALQTARLAGFIDIKEQEELGNQGMQESGAAKAAWLQARVSNIPLQGNRLLITHRPNVSGAFPELEPALAEGEAIIFDPSTNSAIPIARVKIGEWEALNSFGK